MVEFDLKKIYYSIASYKGLPFPIGINELPDYKVKQWENRIDLLKGEKDVRDMYGRPFIAHATLGGIELGSSKDDHILLQPLILIEGKKKIVKIHIEGSVYPGSIKQFINFDDYKLKIYGALINRNQKEYPYQQVQVLKDVWQKNEALDFSCVITDDLFDFVVLEKMKLHELTKSPGIQMYEIEAYSDADIEIERLKGDD